MTKKLLLLALVSLNVLYAHTLTIEESVQKTLAYHPDIKIFISKVQQAEKGYHAAYADFLPQVNLQANYAPTQTFALPVNGTFHTVDEKSWNVGVTLKQKLWDFSKTASKVDASLLDQDIAALSLAEAKALLAYKVKSLYKLMVVQKELIIVRQKDLEVKQAYYAQAKALLKQGLKTKADTSRFLSEVYVAKDALAKAQTAYEKARQSLSFYMGEPIPKDVTLQSAIFKEELPLDASLSKEVLEENLQLKIDALTIDKNALLHKASKAAHFGSIDLLASYNALETLNRYDSKYLGVGVNVPLYSGGRVRAQEQQAKIATQIAKAKKISQTLSLKEELSSLFLDIKQYHDTIKAKKAQLQAVKEARAVLEGRYKVGLTTYIELLDASSKVLASKLGLLEAYYAQSLLVSRITYLKGKI